MADASTKREQDSKVVDTAIGYVIMFGAGMVLLPVLARNIEPYRDTLVTLSSGLILWIVRLPLIGWGLAAAIFAGVQLAEIWPMLTEESEAEKESDEWATKQQKLWLLAIIAYAIDAFQCARYWPVLQDGTSIQMLIVGFNLQMINLGNLGQTILTLFGCALFILLYRFTRKVA